MPDPVQTYRDWVHGSSGRIVAAATLRMMPGHFGAVRRGPRSVLPCGPDVSSKRPVAGPWQRLRTDPPSPYLQRLPLNMMRCTRHPRPLPQGWKIKWRRRNRPCRRTDRHSGRGHCRGAQGSLGHGRVRRLGKARGHRGGRLIRMLHRSSCAPSERVHENASTPNGAFPCVSVRGLLSACGAMLS